SSNTLKESIFKVSEEDATNATLDDVKETLFTSDYTPPKSSEVNEANEEDPHTESVSKGLLSTIAGLVLLLCGGVYAIFNKMTSYGNEICPKIHVSMLPSISEIGRQVSMIYVYLR